jgi:hypothetical protein
VALERNISAVSPSFGSYTIFEFSHQNLYMFLRSGVAYKNIFEQIRFGKPEPLEIELQMANGQLLIFQTLHTLKVFLEQLLTIKKGFLLLTVNIIVTTLYLSLD